MSEQTGSGDGPISSEVMGSAKEGSATCSETEPAGCVWPVVLFLATCVSTCFVGAAHWNPTAYLGDFRSAWQVLEAHWPKG
ncbi:MAG TPA: hypothetical protein PK777_10865, partial [Thermoguttaceae bacterium]|nr:hypothetical protein [Thermoguttaceae bacterium]